jgi:hypothetical protein
MNFTAEKMIDAWIAAFGAGDWAFIARQEHARDGERQKKDSHLMGLHKAGWRVVDSKLRTFSYPKWSIFRTTRLHPKPEFWCDIFLELPDGRKSEIWIALAPYESTYRTSYYVDTKAKPVRKLDLRAERIQVLKFLGTAGKAIGKLRPPLFELMELEFSTQQGFLNLSLDTQSSEPGRIFTHPEFRVLKRYNWAGFSEMGEVLTDDAGTQLTLTKKKGSEIWDGPGGGASFDTHIGNMIVSVVTEFRDSGGMKSWPVSDTAQFGVSETEGHFGFPLYKARGKENWLKRP